MEKYDIMQVGIFMLKIIFDTNIFRKTELDSLEDYRLSSCFEKIVYYVRKAKIQDVNICMNEMALLEYVEQKKIEYENLVYEYKRIVKKFENYYPIQKMYFRESKDFEEEFKQGLLEYLFINNVHIINTIPKFQSDGVKVVDIVEKTIEQVKPFSKNQNNDIKDAIISETVYSCAKEHPEETYLLITDNKRDFIENEILINNYKIDFICNNRSLYEILSLLKKYGAYVSNDIIDENFAYDDRVQKDIKYFIENQILTKDYYDTDVVAKKHNSFYYVEHQRGGDDLIINFYLISVDSEFQCGIIYDANLPKRKIKNKFITFLTIEGEEVYYDQF